VIDRPWLEQHAPGVPGEIELENRTTLVDVDQGDQVLGPLVATLSRYALTAYKVRRPTSIENYVMHDNR
jgi:hypothetical protein